MEKLKKNFFVFHSYHKSILYIELLSFAPFITLRGSVETISLMGSIKI